MDEARNTDDRPGAWDVPLAALGVALGGDAALEDGIAPFREVMRSGLLLAALERRLAELAAGTIRTEPLTRADAVTVVERDGLRVRARIVRPRTERAASVAMLARHTLVGNNGRSVLTVYRFRQPQPEPNDVFDRTRRLSALPPLQLEPGSAIALRAARDGFEITAEGEAGVALIADGPASVPLRWHHDRVTLRPVLAEPSRREWSRLREMIRFAEALADPRLGFALCELLEHPSHFLRWSAARGAVRLQPEAGRLAMRVLASDPHAQVRAAAQATIEGGLA